MRVLHVTHALPPFAHGGTETYLLALARGQIRAGHEVSILAGRDAGVAGAAPSTVGGVPVAWLPPLAQYFADDQVDGPLAASGARLVHVHHWHHVSSRLVRAARSLGAGVVVSLHDFFASCPRFFRLPDDVHPCAPDVAVATCAACVGPPGAPAHEDLIRSYRDAFRAELLSAHVVLAISEVQRDYLLEVPFFSGIGIRVLPLPPPGLPPAPVRTERTRRDGPLRIVSWGGLVPGKGLATLVEAAELLEDSSAVSITHFGRILDEPFRERLLGLARRTRLVFAGPYGAEDITGRFADFDLAVFPSMFMETHGLAVDEALLAGLPVVVSDRGAPRLRVGGRGRVFPAGDGAALAAILEALLADPAELDRMRAAPPGPMTSHADHLAALDAVYEHCADEAARECPGG